MTRAISLRAVSKQRTKEWPFGAMRLVLAVTAVLAPEIGGLPLARSELETQHTQLEILPRGVAHRLGHKPTKDPEGDDASPQTSDAGHSSRKANAQRDASNKETPKKEPSSETASTTGSVEDEFKQKYGVDIHNITANYTRTWGDAKHNVMGLPSYVAVLVGGTIAALIVICTNSIGGRLAHPLPFLASDEQKMKDQIEQARDKVRLLQAAVQAKCLQEEALAEDEARRAAGDAKKPDGPTRDELVGEMLYRTQEVQRSAVGAANDTMKQAAPLIARASHVQNVLKESMTGVQERVGDLALKEATQMYAKMKDAIGVEDGNLLDSAELPNWFKADDESELDPPPFALLLGGMFAPAQIKMTRSQCQSQIIWNSIILATCVACFTMDGHHGCPDRLVWAWIYGMLILNAIDVVCCSCIAARCATAIGTLQEDEDATTRIRKTGNGVWDMFITLQANSGQFFKAYFAYQNVVDSPIYTMQRFMGFVSLGWGIFGMWITIEDVVKDTLTCDAKIILWFMHTYSWFFLLFLTWTALGLVLWLLRKLSGFTFVTAPIMKEAKEADDEVPFRLPLFQTLARSFLLRDSSTMLHIKAKQVEKDVTNFEQEIKDTKEKLRLRKAYLDQLEKSRVAAAANEKNLIETYKDKAREEGKLVDEVPFNPEDEHGSTSFGGAAGASSSGSAAGASSSNVFGGASSVMQPEHLAGFMQQASDAASSAGAASSSGAQSYLEQIQASAASAHAAASSAATGALASPQAAGFLPTNELASPLLQTEVGASSSQPIFLGQAGTSSDGAVAGGPAANQATGSAGEGSPANDDQESY